MNHPLGRATAQEKRQCTCNTASHVLVEHSGRGKADQRLRGHILVDGMGALEMRLKSAWEGIISCPEEEEEYSSCLMGWKAKYQG